METVDELEWTKVKAKLWGDQADRIAETMRMVVRLKYENILSDETFKTIGDLLSAEYHKTKSVADLAAAEVKQLEGK